MTKGAPIYFGLFQEVSWKNTQFNTYSARFNITMNPESVSEFW